MSDDEFAEDFEEELESVESEEEPGRLRQVNPAGPERHDGMPSFLRDPYPPVTLFLVIVGLVIIVGTPYNIWYVYSYALLAAYMLMILTTVGIIFSLELWYGYRGGRLRWGGLTNLVVISVGGILGIIDLLFWVFAGRPLVEGMTSPIASVTSLIVVFSLYSLWILKRTQAQS